MSIIKRIISVINSTADNRVRIYIKLIYRCKIKRRLRLGRIVSNRLQRKYGVFLPVDTEFTPCLTLRHPVGVVIGTGVYLGKNITIYQNVTIGRGRLESISYPKIGDNSVIYAGAVIIGDITIGENCIIGANAVVTNNIPDNCVAVGSPAKWIRRK